MLPAIADYAAVSGSSARSASFRSQRFIAGQWMQALIDLGRFTSSLVTQVRLDSTNIVGYDLR